MNLRPLDPQDSAGRSGAYAAGCSRVASKKADRVGFRFEDIAIGDRTEKRKVRVFKSTGERIGS